MRASKSYAVSNFQIYSIINYDPYTIYYISMTYFTTGSLYFFTPFIRFAHCPPPHLSKPTSYSLSIRKSLDFFSSWVFVFSVSLLPSQKTLQLWHFWPPNVWSKPLWHSVHFSSVCSVLSDSATPWIAARQASLSITNSRSSPKLMCTKSVMPSSHLILCHPLLLLPLIPPSIRVFSSESTLCMRWPKYWSFSFSISPSKEHPGLISFRMDWLDLLAVQGTLKSRQDWATSLSCLLGVSGSALCCTTSI